MCNLAVFTTVVLFFLCFFFVYSMFKQLLKNIVPNERKRFASRKLKVQNLSSTLNVWSRKSPLSTLVVKYTIANLLGKSDKFRLPSIRDFDRVPSHEHRSLWNSFQMVPISKLYVYTSKLIYKNGIMDTNPSILLKN